MLLIAGLFGAGAASATATPTGALDEGSSPNMPGSSATAGSCATQTTSPIAVPGSSNVDIVDTCQSSQNSVTGGEQLAPASFALPTKTGDLLVAAVLCGVLNGGMDVPKLVLPPGWTRAKRHTGGIQGGLEASIFYRADNPGGITSITLGREPTGNNDVFCTTFTWDIAGAGTAASLDATGYASVTGGTSINVATSGPTTKNNDLLLMAETDGSEYPPNQYQVSNHFDMVSAWTNGQVDQPGTFSTKMAGSQGVCHSVISQWSNWLDSTAVMVALRLSG